jgi:hypothetical protein
VRSTQFVGILREKPSHLYFTREVLVVVFVPQELKNIKNIKTNIIFFTFSYLNKLKIPPFIKTGRSKNKKTKINIINTT